MRFYNRKGKLYLETYEGNKRIRKSLGLEDTPDNRALMFIKLGGQVDGGKQHSARMRQYESFKKRDGGAGGMGRLKIAAVLEKYAEVGIGLKESSRRTMRACTKRMLELLGHPTYIDEITKQSVHRYYNALAIHQFSRYHTRTLIHTLKNFLEFAMTMDYIQANPFFKRRVKTRPPVGKQPLNAQEVNEVINTCTDDLMRTYLIIAFFTGARPGEILALRRDDLDFAKSTLRIERTISERGEITPPKTQSSRRTIEMPAIVKNALQHYIAKAGIQDALFPNPPKKRLRFNEKWRALLEKCGIAQRRLYSTRHTFASLMLSYGANLLYTSAVLGHQSADMTLKAYASYIPNPHSSMSCMDSIALGAHP